MNKLIENKETKLLDPNGQKVLKYSDLLIYVLNRPVDTNTGFSLKQMRDDLLLLNIFEKAEGTIELTTEQLKRMIDLVNTTTWSTRHIDILNFADYLESNL